MEKAEVTQWRKAGEFTRFQKRCTVHERDGTWPSAFSKALCMALVAAGIGPGELARKTGRDYRGVWCWTSGKRSPRRKTAVEVERVLNLRPGELVQHAGDSEQLSSVRMKKLWDQRRRKAETLEGRYKKMMAGEYHGGVSPVDSLKNAKAVQALSPRPHQTTLQGRVRRALARVCYSVDGTFVTCPGCRKSLYRPNCHIEKSESHWHPRCWRDNLAGNPRGHRPQSKSGSSIVLRVRATLINKGLGKTVSQVAEDLLGLSDADSKRATEQMLRRGRNDFNGLLWGDLFPAKGTTPQNIHKVLKNFQVDEVLQIAAGEHPYSKVVDVSDLEDWVPMPRQSDPLYGFHVADTPLARQVADTISERFDSIGAAAKSVGLTHDTLKEILEGKERKLWRETLTALTTLVGQPLPATVSSE